jgi:hypothetical protein
MHTPAECALFLVHAGQALTTPAGTGPEQRQGTPYGIFGNGVVLLRLVQGRRFLGSRRLECVLSVYRISENALVELHLLI